MRHYTDKHTTVEEAQIHKQVRVAEELGANFPSKYWERLQAWTEAAKEMGQYIKRRSE